MMNGNGFFIGKTSSTGSGRSNVSKNGNNIVFSLTDPIYIDKNDRVFYSKEKRNAYLSMNGKKVIAEKVL